MTVHDHDQSAPVGQGRHLEPAADTDGRIAIIGMAGRFPGARNIATFWSNLRGGVEAIRRYSEAELVAAGEKLDNVRDAAYVRAAAPLDDIDQFDAPFFSMSPRDAAVFDPQHRLFLEVAWEAFEHAGYVGEPVEGAVGVFASCGLSEYMFKNVMANETVAASVGEWLVRHTGNDTNFLATRVSYEFDLHGPSLNVQTACSSTLVAVHLAVQSLLSGECDMALAGGAVVAPVQHRGYLYKEGEILSADGHCRAFDAKAAGTIISSACGAVLLKPLAHAIDDGDNILAVVRGSAINNDGRNKVGYLAPSVGGQARVVAEALAVSGIEARDVTYVEAHGTGTLIGDPIEIAGLTQAYRLSTDDTQFCAIGSLKSNIGHTGEAAGVGSLIKTVLSLQHREIPPSLHYESPNPQADFPNSPFFVNAALRAWEPGPTGTRIAGITGLGAGGTNAHILIEEPPAFEPSDPPARAAQIVTVSARTDEAVKRAAADLSQFLRDHPDANLADVAYTRLVGRKAFGARRSVVASTTTEAAAALDALPGVSGAHLKGDAPSIVFMMPGGGAQYAGMGRELYEQEPAYREVIDRCAALLRVASDIDLIDVLYGGDPNDAADIAARSRRLERPSVALPALFATSYAMATWLATFGVVPDAMIGHSAGEYVAAALSGVISMDDGLALVALRGRLFDTLAEGTMLSVPLPEAEVRDLMPEGLSIAAVNAPGLCVTSGPVALIEQFQGQLADRDVDSVRIHIDVAAHSSMLEPILAEFGAFCRTITFHAPGTPYVSNLTGTWVTRDDVVDPDYWVRHLRNTVRFSEGIEAILADPNRFLIEIGPGRTLVGLARQASNQPAGSTPTLRHPQEAASDVAVALGAIGRAWEAGLVLDPALLWPDEARRRIPLPTYPFERQRYWVDPDPIETTGHKVAVNARGALRKRHDVGEWFYAPAWRRSVPGPKLDAGASVTWMVLTDGAPLAGALARRLVSERDRIITVSMGERFLRRSAISYTVNPGRSTDWIDLIDAVRNDGGLPDRIVHMTAIGPSRGRRRFGADDDLVAYQETVARDQASVLFLAQALSGQAEPLRFALVTSGAQAISAETDKRPERALLHGAVRVIPRELGHVDAATIDVDLPPPGSAAERTLVDRLARELSSEWADELVVYRSGERWVREFEPLSLAPAEHTPWRSGGVYLITGGLGGIGLSVAKQIAKSCDHPTLVLLGRSELPAERTWTQVVESRSGDEGMRRKIAAVQELRSLGAEVTLATGDVADLAEMRALVGRVRKHSGRITGVIHSAGILRDALIALRTPTAESAVVDTKALGALVLERVLANDPPDLFVLFSSVSSIIGLPGQIDYSAANAFLDAFAMKVNTAGWSRALVVNWNAWQEVGMAVEAAQTEAGKAPSVAADANTPEHLFDTVDGEGNEVVEFSTGYSRKRQWLLSEHVVRDGDALMPGTGFIEMLRAAATHDGPGPVELRDVFFLSPFVVGLGEARTLKVKVERPTGAVPGANITVFSDNEASPHVTATAERVERREPKRHDLDAIRARCTDELEEWDGYSDQPFMDFGPRWGSLRSVAFGEGEALVTTRMPSDFEGELETFWLHPALLDVATGSAQKLIPGFDQETAFFVPFSYGRLRVDGPLPASAVSHVRLHNGSSPDLAVFDVTICDEAGLELVDIDNLTMRRIAAGAALTSLRPGDTGVDEPAGLETTIEAALREGILPVEGVDALDRILAAGLSSQVVATSVDLHQWIAKVDAEAAGDADCGGADAPQYERPNVSSEYAAPATPIERELGALWCDLLGVERVGRHDDFFELGGHSLIAVRLFTRIRKKYSIELALATLFEAPTIAQCASIVAAKLGLSEAIERGEAGGHGGGAPTISATSVTAEPRPFRSLVTIQRGSADRTPFYCIHGSGGNVLNFRDLSLAMGRSQPFYGIQARGVDGALTPHRTIGEMAAAYLEEIRTIQPEGPYILGGYSGGGLIAYEMSKQVAASGDSVALLVLLDTFPPQVPDQRMTIGRRLHQFRKDRFGYLRHIVEHRRFVRNRNAGLAIVDQFVSRGEVIPSDLRALSIERAFMAAANNYTLTSWDGPRPDRVVLLRAEHPHFSFEVLGPAYGWDKVVGNGFELVTVPGDHDSLLLEPNASTLVRKLRDTITNAQFGIDE